MCTVMFYPETLPAEKRSVGDSRKAVDRLMEYDRKLDEGFSEEELRKLFAADAASANYDDYSALTAAERRLFDALGLVPPKPHDSDDPRAEGDPAECDIAARRRRMKADVIEPPILCEDTTFCGSWNFRRSGRIFVWLDSMSFGNSEKTGFYYVRDQLSMLYMWTTAYAHPLLIVQKSKLRPDQIEYMERKCRETREAAERAAAADSRGSDAAE